MGELQRPIEMQAPPYAAESIRGRPRSILWDQVSGTAGRKPNTRKQVHFQMATNGIASPRATFFKSESMKLDAENLHVL